MSTPWIALFAVLPALAALLVVPATRRFLFIRPLLRRFRKVVPAISATEQEALEAGSVWWDGELFSGRPNWQHLLDMPKPALRGEEQAFLDGPVEELCRRLDDWHITHEEQDLPAELWRHLEYA